MSMNFCGCLDIQLHQIDQRRAAGDEANFRSLLRRRRLRRRSNRLRAVVGPRELKVFMPVSAFWRFAAHSESRHDVLIGAAAADIAAHEFFHLGVLRSAWFFQQRHRRHDLARCAITALIGVVRNERGLHRMQVFRLTNAFDRRDLVALMHRGKAKTRIHAPTIDVHRAGTALAMIASLLRSGQVQMFAETIEKSRARIDPKIIFLSVHTERNGNRILQVG